MNPAELLIFLEIVDALFRQRPDPEGSDEAYHRGTSDMAQAFRAYAENHLNELERAA